MTHLGGGAVIFQALNMTDVCVCRPYINLILLQSLDSALRLFAKFEQGGDL